MGKTARPKITIVTMSDHGCESRDWTRVERATKATSQTTSKGRRATWRTFSMNVRGRRGRSPLVWSMTELYRRRNWAREVGVAALGGSCHGARDHGPVSLRRVGQSVDLPVKARR
jgi:hypothetical protein